MINISEIKNQIKTNNVLYKNQIKNLSDNNKINISPNKIDDITSNFQKLSYLINSILCSLNKNFLNQQNFLKKLTDEINNTTELKFSKHDIYYIMKKLIPNYNIYKKFCKNNKSKSNLVQLGGNPLAHYYGWGEDTATYTKLFDVIGSLLDLVGMIPVVGIAADAVTIILNVMRGISAKFSKSCNSSKYFIQAALSVIAIIPVVGEIGPALKIGYQLVNNGLEAKYVEENLHNCGNNDYEEDDYEDDYDEDEEDYD